MATLSQLESVHKEKVDQVCEKYLEPLLSIMAKIVSSPTREDLESIVKQTPELLEGLDKKDATQILKVFNGCSDIKQIDYQSDELKELASKAYSSLEEVKFDPERLGLMHVILLIVRKLR